MIENDVSIGGDVSIRDTDAHPRNATDRIAGLPPGSGEIRPVRICKNAWIGNHIYILKGVTIGEGAIIGAGSVVVTDIPPHSVAIGNPARVVMKNVKAFTMSGAVCGDAPSSRKLALGDGPQRPNSASSGEPI